MEESRKKKLVEKTKMGRPVTWTDEIIEELADKLIKWAENENSFALAQFYRDEKITRTRLHYLASKSPNFKDALMYTRYSLASRMIESLIFKDGRCHPVFFNKYIRYVDVDLDAFMKEQEKTQVEEMNKRDVRIINFADYKKELDNGKEV